MSTENQLRSIAINRKLNAAIPVYDEHTDTLGVGDERIVPFEVVIPTTEGETTVEIEARFTRPPVAVSETETIYPILMSFELGDADLRAVIREGEATLWAEGFSTTMPKYEFIQQDINGTPVWIMVAEWRQERYIDHTAAPVYLRHLLMNILIGIENVVTPLYPEIGQERFLKDLFGDESGAGLKLDTLRSSPQAMQTYYELFTEFNQYRKPEGQAKLSEPSVLEAVWAGWISRLKPHFITLEDLTQGPTSIEA